MPCAPAVLQQEYESNFIQTLRANGGDQALVPTTEVHNVFDEVVEPQAGTGASAFLDGASNVEVQSVCPVGMCEASVRFPSFVLVSRSGCWTCLI